MANAIRVIDEARALAITAASVQIAAALFGLGLQLQMRQLKQAPPPEDEVLETEEADYA